MVSVRSPTHEIHPADDAEYVGTNGWFRLKYQNKRGLTTDAAQTITTILGLQQDLILAKALPLGQTEAALRARRLIETSREVGALKGQPLLYPAEYKARADALVEARRLVGGVDIEKVAAGAESFTAGIEA